MKKVFAAAALIAVTTGCTTHGHSVDQSQIAGSTAMTKLDVHAKLGQPTIVRDIPTGVLWDYIKIENRPSGYTYIPIVGMFAGGGTYTTEVTRVVFNVEGQMIHTYTENDKESDNMWAGMIRLADDAASGDSNHEKYIARSKAEMTGLGLPFVMTKELDNTVAFYAQYEKGK